MKAGVDPSAGRMGGSTHPRRHAPDEMARIMDVPPVLVPEILRDGTRLTRRWAHAAVHEHMQGMDSHVIVGSYGRPVDISWRVERKRFHSRTRRDGFTLIPESVDGRWDFGGGVTVSHVYLPKERLQACADLIAQGKPVELLVRVAFEDPTTARILEILSREAVQSEGSFRLFLEQAIDLLCLQLIRAHSAFGASAPPFAKGLARWQVKRVTAYMRENLDRSVGLAELAALVDLSRFHFCRALRLATGHTPHQWLMRARMERARRLLADPSLSVTDIALSVGYETPSAFTASFRRIVGMTPSQFRRSL